MLSLAQFVKFTCCFDQTEEPPQCLLFDLKVINGEREKMEMSSSQSVLKFLLKSEHICSLQTGAKQHLQAHVVGTREWRGGGGVSLLPF